MKKPITCWAASVEIIEAVYRYSHTVHRPFILSINKQQVDHSGGYLYNWTTKEFVQYCQTLRKEYDDADVIFAREHCGPGFNDINDLEDSFKTIIEDIKSGIHMYHIDFSRYLGPRKTAIDRTVEAIKFLLKKKPDAIIEIGTDEHSLARGYNQVRKDLDLYLSFCKPAYYIFDTGSYVKEDKQVGFYDRQEVQNTKLLLNDYNIKLKEHNSDFLPVSQIKEREELDSIQIGYELGLRQIEKMISLAKAKKIPHDYFIQGSYKSKKWQPILDLDITLADDEYNCGMLAGQFNLDMPQYQRLHKNLSNEYNLKEELIQTALDIIDRYCVNF